MTSKSSQKPQNVKPFWTGLLFSNTEGSQIKDLFNNLRAFNFEYLSMIDEFIAKSEFDHVLISFFEERLEQSQHDLVKRVV